MDVTRRDSLKLLGAGAVAGAALGTPLRAPAQAQPAAGADALGAVGQQGAGFYRFKVGDIEAAVVSDGTFPFPPGAHPLFGANASKEEVAKALDAAFIPQDRVTGHVNALVLRTPKQGVVIVDAGGGSLLGPTTGKFRGHLARMGIQPKDVKAVIITHAHRDHIGGLLDEGGKPTYPDAQHFAHKDEFPFWTAPNVDLSRSTAPPQLKQSIIQGAQQAHAAIRGKLEPFEDGARVVEGVQVVAAPGHTPGHSTLLIASGGQQLLYITDAAHHAALNMAHPDWHVGFDADPVEAARARRKVLDRAAADRVLVSGSHLPFPAVGHVRAKGNGFEWVPAVWEWNQ